MLIVPFFEALLIGFSFWKEPNSLQGLQNEMFSIFILLNIFPNLIQQPMPYFISQRALYEVRERPSKTYSWKAFMMASIVVELLWNILMAAPLFICWYVPAGLYNNAIASDTVIQRVGIMFLLVVAFMTFASTFGSMIIAGIEHDQNAANLTQLLFVFSLFFCG
jgi:ATP-binding cassette, subfamily G (WHITE), member 2, PDR